MDGVNQHIAQVYRATDMRHIHAAIVPRQCATFHGLGVVSLGVWVVGQPVIYVVQQCVANVTNNARSVKVTCVVIVVNVGIVLFLGGMLFIVRMDVCYLKVIEIIKSSRIVYYE